VVLPVSVFEHANNAFYKLAGDGRRGMDRYWAVTASRTFRKGRDITKSTISRRGTPGSRYLKPSFAKLGVAICWDQWFPETARCMALMGAEILLYPTAIGSEPRIRVWIPSAHWQRTMQGSRRGQRHAAGGVESSRHGTGRKIRHDLLRLLVHCLPDGRESSRSRSQQRDGAHRHVRLGSGAPLPAGVGRVP